jgi:hypothetical protein
MTGPVWTNLALWACSVVAGDCSPGTVPDQTIIQRAYDREVSNASSLHDRNLKVLEAKCDDRRADGRFLCQVTFLSTDDPTQRLYFDIVAVAPLPDGGWELKSGLCRR